MPWLLWLALACFGLLWLTLACFGWLWLALACFGLLWLAFGLLLACLILPWLALAWAALAACAFRSIAAQVLPLLAAFFALVALFFVFLTRLNSSCVFSSIFPGSFEVLEGFWEGFERDFGRIFMDVW